MNKEMSAEAQARLTAFNEDQSDWEGICRKCGAKLKGTLKQLKEHVCGKQSSTDTSSA